MLRFEVNVPGYSEYSQVVILGAGATDNAGNSAAPVSISYTVQAPPNVTGSLSISSTGLFYNRIQKTGTETVTLTNTSGQALAAPLQLVLAGLPGNVSLKNASGVWGGNPYVTVTTTSLAPGASVSVTLTFSYALGTNFTVTPSLYSDTLRN